MSANDAIVASVVNYGLAGVVVYIFYRLISNELKELRQTIMDLNKTISELVVELRRVR